MTHSQSVVDFECKFQLLEPIALHHSHLSRWSLQKVQSVKSSQSPVKGQQICWTDLWLISNFVSSKNLYGIYQTLPNHKHQWRNDQPNNRQVQICLKHLRFHDHRKWESHGKSWLVGGWSTELENEIVKLDHPFKYWVDNSNKTLFNHHRSNRSEILITPWFSLRPGLPTTSTDPTSCVCYIEIFPKSHLLGGCLKTVIKETTNDHFRLI